MIQASGNVYTANPYSRYAGYEYGANVPSSGSNLRGAFWSLGFGNPALGSGDDNGAFPPNSFLLAVGPSFDYGDGTWFSYSTTLNTNWAAANSIDGCVTNNDVSTPCTCVLLTSGDPYDGDSYMALVSALADSGGNFFIPGDVVLSPAPAPVITNSVRNGNGVDLTVMVPVPDATNGVNQHPSCNCLAGGTFKVYAQEVARGGASPGSRDVGQWTRIDTGAGMLGGSASASAACSGTDTDLYLAAVITFDSGFETTHVSTNSTRVHCGPTLAEPEPIKRRPARPADRGGKPSTIR